MTDQTELREQIVAVLDNASVLFVPSELADAVLAVPALQRALATQAALTRLPGKAMTLSKMALEHDVGSSERLRLSGKAAGVNLAISFIDEALRAVSQ